MQPTLETQNRIFSLPETDSNAEAPDIAVLRAQAESRFQAALVLLARQTPEQWEASSREELDPAEKKRIAELLAKSRDAGLTQAEQAEMQDYIGENEALAVTRAAALFLLQSHRKGQK